jgi:hypothetical protein
VSFDENGNFIRGVRLTDEEMKELDEFLSEIGVNEEPNIIDVLKKFVFKHIASVSNAGKK